MTSFDNLYLKISWIKDDKKRLLFSSLLSLLPILNIYLKLTIKKENGKKPFPNDFEYQKKINEITKAKEVIINSVEKKKVDEEVKPSLKECSKIVSLTKEKIILPSLKDDYQFIKGSIDDCLNYLNEVNND